MLAKELGDPVDEHADLDRQVPILRIHDIERRGLREPVAEQQFKIGAVSKSQLAAFIDANL